MLTKGVKSAKYKKLTAQIRAAKSLSRHFNINTFRLHRFNNKQFPSYRLTYTSFLIILNAGIIYALNAFVPLHFIKATVINRADNFIHEFKPKNAALHLVASGTIMRKINAFAAISATAADNVVHP
jgi:hypothetical protein